MAKNSNSELLRKVASGELPLHKLEEHTDPKNAAAIRRQFLEQTTGQSLDSIGAADIEYERILNRNVENAIGAVQIPMGVAGPVRINGEHAKGSFYVPLATTEGALVASMARGMKAITASGGANVRVIRDAIARAPLFELESAVDAAEFLKWVEQNDRQIKAAAAKTLNHGSLIHIMPFILGNNVWLRFSFKTGDAMGMNMSTIASEAAAEYIEAHFPKARMVSVSGNMCSDKKESYVNDLLGRGKTVVADVLVKADVLEKMFKVDAKRVVNTNTKKNLLGSSRAGSSKHNAHVANPIAAIFAATGQDLAQVVESSSGYTWAETRGRDDSDLYISVTLPSLEIGTVGGGTGLKHQSEALSIMGVKGGGKEDGQNALKFAEIIAATVLAGELNLLCAQAGRELGKAHAKLGQNKKA